MLYDMELLITFPASQLKIVTVLVFEGRASLFKDASKILIDIFFNDAFLLHKLTDNITWNSRMGEGE
jgi:hypothetical protein